VVTVEIQGQRYPVRSALEPAYVLELAAYVDDKMRAAADETPTGDSLKIAVLAALNIADEYFHFRRTAAPDARMMERAEGIERVLDAVLAECD
jgi:cell division protein ZapA